jgi:hypothetical protein
VEIRTVQKLHFHVDIKFMKKIMIYLTHSLIKNWNMENYVIVGILIFLLNFNSYRLWYKHKRGEGPKPITKPKSEDSNDFMSKLIHYVRENEQRKSKRKTNPTRSAI